MAKAGTVNPKTNKPYARSTKGTRKDAIARMLAQEIGLDATMEVVQNPEQQEYDDAGNIVEGKTIPMYGIWYED